MLDHSSLATTKRYAERGTMHTDRRTPTDYGLHAIALGSFAGQAILLAVIAWQLHRSQMAMRIDAARWLNLALLLSVWALGVWAKTPRLSERALAVVVMATFSFAGLFGQYAALSLDRPWADPLLAAWDRALGVDVPALVAWTAQHPQLRTGLVIAYGSFLQQAVVCPFLFACVSSRERLWTYVLSYQLSWTVALVCLAIWPSEYSFTYLGYAQDPHLVGATALLPDLLGARLHTLGTIVVSQTNGLITFPSFHTMLAMFVTWTALERQWLGAVALPLNVGLIAGTVLLGPHYAVDVAASLLLTPAIVWGARRLVRRAFAGNTFRQLPLRPNASTGSTRAHSGHLNSENIG
jgi:membrane-associated phospholipid phosphatase